VALSGSQAAESLTIGPGATLDITNGSTLGVLHTINNAGVIEFSSSGGDTVLAVTGELQLTGGGQVQMMDTLSGGTIVGLPLVNGVPSTGATFDNVDNHIVGSGLIGVGNDTLTFINQSAGEVDATGLLVIDTGDNQVANSGTMEASSGGNLAILAPLLNSGEVLALDGSEVNIFADVENTSQGVIAALGAGAVVSFLAGSTLTNAGTLEAANGGIVDVVGNVNNSNGELLVQSGGAIDIGGTVSGGSAVIEGGALTLASADLHVAFDNGPISTPSYGELILDSPGQFSGDIAGFAGTSPSQSDAIDLVGFDASGPPSETVNGANIVLTLSNGGTDISLTFDNFSGSFDIAASAAGTIITDPPLATVATSDAGSATATGSVTLATTGAGSDFSASFAPGGGNYIGAFSLDTVKVGNDNASVGWGFSLDDDQINLAPGETVTQSYAVNLAQAQGPSANQTVSVTIGGAGDDNFVFHPGLGADTIVNFNPQSDTIDLQGFGAIHSEQQLVSLITTDGHGDAVLDLGHHDSITLPGMNAAELHAMLQSVVHLH
jgi:VCBS repeat-containing protein